MLKNLTLLLLLLPATMFAQITITGKVVGMADKKAVPSASVFLNKTSVGGATHENGTFTLDNVHNGQYELMVQCVGFEPYSQSLQITGTEITLPVIELMPKVTVLKEVKIKFDADRQRHLAMMLAEFLGRTENAADCKVLNPEIIDLDYDSKNGRITAGTNDFLIIENNALGYRIKYQLQDFDFKPRAGTVFYSGKSVFEPMKGSGSQEKKWQKNRIAAYRGSEMHFLRACIANNVAEEGFAARQLIRKPNTARPPDSVISAKLEAFYNTKIVTISDRVDNADSIKNWNAKARLPRYNEQLNKIPLTSTDYIKLTERKGIYGAGYKDCLVITYKDIKSTIITFRKTFAFFDDNGIVLNPDSNFLEGYWGGQRLAELLPDDYQLPTTF